MRAVGGLIGTLLVLMMSAAAASAAGEASGDSRAAPLATPLILVQDAGAVTRDGITVRVTRGTGGLEVEGRFTIDAPASAAWSVLTDYDSIERFVSSMRESRIARRDADTIWVEQRAVGRMLLFTRKLRTTLRIQEIPQARIDFEDVLGSDFKRYRGEWLIWAEADGRSAVVYRLQADPSFGIPDFVARGLFRGAAQELLSQVRAEIERRAALAAR